MKLKKRLDILLCNFPLLYLVVAKMFKRESFSQKVPYLKYVKKGFVALDIGANNGIVSLLLSCLVGRKGKVHAFEPIPATFALLEEYVSKYFVYNNYQLHNCAISDKEEKVNILIPGNDYGQASMKTHESGSWKDQSSIQVVEVDSKKIDGFEGRLGKVDFIKIDIEGAELLALKGAHQLILTYKPILYLEVYQEWTKEFGYSPVDLYDYIRSLGYSKIWAYSHFHFVDISDNKAYLENQLNSIDILCLA